MLHASNASRAYFRPEVNQMCSQRASNASKSRVVNFGIWMRELVNSVKQIARLVNLHPLAWLRASNRRHLGPVRLVVCQRLLVDVRLQPLVEVVRADARNDNRKEEQQDRQNRKSCQRLAGRLVVLLALEVRHVHADELEQKVRQSYKVHKDAANHACNGLATHPEGGSEEQEEGDDERSRSEGDLDGGRLFDDDKELNRKGEEEEEIELEECDVNLADVSNDI
jgi:hypothetical protein